MIGFETIFDSDREEYEFMQENKEQPMKEQIEEMVKELAEAHHKMDVAWTNHFIDKEKFPKPKPEHTLLAEHLYNAGYRKQEWISVDEALPEEGKNVLCFDGDKTSIAFMEKVEDCGTYVPIFWDFVFYDRDDTWNEVCATHWMPLPEAPKMKGGAE